MADILVYTLNFSPEPTGTGKYTGEMAVWLASRGHSVDVIAAMPHYPAWRIEPTYAGKGFHTEELNGVRIWRVPLYVPSSDRVSTFTRIRLETSYTINALRYWLPILLGSKRYDIVIAVMPPMQISVYPIIYKRLRGTDWILHVQDLQVDAALRLGLLPMGSLSRILYRIENFCLERASRVSTITEAMRQRMVAKGVAASRTWLFPNWADTTFIQPLPRNNSFRSGLGIAPNEVIILYAGNMGEKQGLEVVLHAADRMREAKDLRFVLVGHGAARERLLRMARDLGLANVLFLPVQSLERLPEMLAAGDIHLVVQKREAADLVMPSKLTSIMAAGRAVVATADPGTALHDIVTAHGTGIVTVPEDVDQIVQALKRLVQEPSLREEMGRNARKYAERHLDKDTILQDFEKKILELVAEQRR